MPLKGVQIMENKVHNYKEQPKHIVENGIPYTFDPITQTYLAFADEGPEEEQVMIGRYGQMREKYLKENYEATYSRLLLLNQLKPHLIAIDEQAWEMEQKIVEQLAKADGTDEELKVTDQLKWVGLMNNYRMSAQEIIIKELIESGVEGL